MCQKIKPRHARVAAQQNDIVAINLTLLIIRKASAQTFDVKSTSGCQRFATWHGTWKIRKRKGSPYKTNCHEQEKGVAPPPPTPRTLYRATTSRGLDDPGQAGIHPTFSPTPRVSRIGVFPLDLTPCSKSYSRRPTCPSSFHHCQPPPLPPRKILFLLSQRAALILRQ